MVVRGGRTNCDIGEIPKVVHTNRYEFREVIGCSLDANVLIEASLA